MKTLFRLLVSLVVLYALGAVAYAFLHYPAGTRPDVGGILNDFNNSLAGVFRPTSGSEPTPTVGPAPAVESPTSRLDRLKPNVGSELDLSMDLGRILVPGTTTHLQAEAAATWGALLPIHAKVLPTGIDDLGRLRTLKATDRIAFDRERQAARDRLAAARTTLLEHTQKQDPLDAATKLLDILDRLDARLAAL